MSIQRDSLQGMFCEQKILIHRTTTPGFEPGTSGNGDREHFQCWRLYPTELCGVTATPYSSTYYQPDT